MQGKRGTIKVVTGAGKTILALGIMERLQHEEPELRVAIVVPTIVLLRQWHEVILKTGNIPEEQVGLLGAGHSDSFEGKRILICVLRSAADKLAKSVGKNYANHLLLVIDECHRAGASEMRKVFDVSRAYNLGLSATPEREEYFETDLGDVIEEEYNDTILGRELGPILYEMTLNEAFDMGILPRFEVRHYGITLTGDERSTYESLSRSIQDLSAELRERSGKRSGDKLLFSWCQNAAKRDGVVGELARKYIFQTNQRKRLLYNAFSRQEAVIRLLKDEYQENPEAKAILFHESIEGVEGLYHRLVADGFSVVMEHSKLTETERANNIDAFRSGEAKVIVSARSLIEGFNVPSTDIGFIVASNTSIRQRIQTLGRVLRKPEDGSDKNARVYVLYVHDTTDEVVYAKADWAKLIGSERNVYYRWDLAADPILQDGPPREPLPREKDIDPASLSAGGEYPGEYEGEDFSCDTRGNIFDNEGRPIANPGDLPEQIAAVKGSYGRFKVTPIHKYILVLVPHEEGWTSVFVAQLKEELIRASVARTEDIDIDSLMPGDEFPADMVTGKEEVLFFKQSRGREVIAKKMPRGEFFARVDTAIDPEKGLAAKALLEAKPQLKGTGHDVSRFVITEEGYAVFLDKGKYRLVARIETKLEFPV